MICPAPREVTRLTRIWDKGPLMSLARQQKRKKKIEGKEKKRKKHLERHKRDILY